MGDDELRYGVIGTGMMGVEHVQNLSALAGARVTALADPWPASLDQAARVVGRPVAAFADHRDLLDSGLVEAVVIATPNHTHAAILSDVLQAGLHVLVEKPLCTTVEDCRRSIELARRCASDHPGQVVWMGLEYRYMPPTATLLDVVASGELGPIRMMSVREHRFPFLPKVGSWNRFNCNTGGTLVEKCCHFFDLMNLVMGTRPVRVLASGAQDVNHLDERYDGERSDILDNAFVIVEYEGGARAALDLCMFAEASRNEQEISVVGSEGKVEVLVTEGIVRVGRRADGIGRVRVVPVRTDDVRYEGFHHGASYLEHVDFLHAVRGGGASAVTLEDGLWSVAVGVAAHRSIDEGRPIAMAEVLGS